MLNYMLIGFLVAVAASGFIMWGTPLYRIIFTTKKDKANG